MVNKIIKDYKELLKRRFYSILKSGIHRVTVLDVRFHKKATFPFWTWQLRVDDTDQIITKTISTRNDDRGLGKLKTELSTLGIHISDSNDRDEWMIVKFFQGKIVKIHYNSKNGEIIFIP